MGVGGAFWKSRPEKRLNRRATRAVVVLHAVVVIPMAAKDLREFICPDATNSLGHEHRKSSLESIDGGLAAPAAVAFSVAAGSLLSRSQVEMFR
jgi:hypothetical protein